MSHSYDQYLIRHRANVKKAFRWFRDNLPEVLEKAPGLEWMIYHHDLSKDEPDEYAAYDSYHFGTSKSYDVVEKYKKASLMHIHRNPHHWQHWILPANKRGDGENLIRMPYVYILEMICDWWSFGWEKGDPAEIFRWYEKHKADIRLHPKARAALESVLEQMRIKLR